MPSRNSCETRNLFASETGHTSVPHFVNASSNSLHSLHFLKQAEECVLGRKPVEQADSVVAVEY